MKQMSSQEPTLPEGKQATGTVLDAMPAPPCARLLRYRFLSVDRAAKTMRVSFTASSDMLNPAGTIQGGFLTAMLDDVMGSMIVVLTDGEKYPASIDLHARFLRPAKPGALTGEARLAHMTSSLAFTEADLYDEAGELVASAIQTQRLFPIRSKG